MPAAKKPIAGSTRANAAADPPAKPTTARVCPAKLTRRSTINHPAMPPRTATVVPACSAVTMNGYWNRPVMSAYTFQDRPFTAGNFFPAVSDGRTRPGGVRATCGSSCAAGTSGCPTTTRRPARSWRTSTGVP